MDFNCFKRVSISSFLAFKYISIFYGVSLIFGCFFCIDSSFFSERKGANFYRPLPSFSIAFVG